MITPYLTLGLETDATDEEIRKRYLELCRLCPPARDPQRFEAISAAYDRISTPRRRVEERLFGGAHFESFELSVEDLIRAARQKGPRLSELLASGGFLRG